MGWDEVCILCGIRPYGGPIWFCGTRQKNADDLADEIRAAGFNQLPAINGNKCAMSTVPGNNRGGLLQNLC